MNAIQQKLLLDRIFEPQNLPALKKIMKVSLSSHVGFSDPSTTDYHLRFTIDRREIERFRSIEGERYLLSNYLDNLTRYVGGI